MALRFNRLGLLASNVIKALNLYSHQFLKRQAAGKSVLKSSLWAIWYLCSNVQRVVALHFFSVQIYARLVAHSTSSYGWRSNASIILNPVSWSNSTILSV